jgi:hypothetical protein
MVLLSMVLLETRGATLCFEGRFVITSLQSCQFEVGYVYQQSHR